MGTHVPVFRGCFCLLRRESKFRGFFRVWRAILDLTATR